MISNEIIKFASNTSNVGLTHKYTFRSLKKNPMCGDLIKIELISKNSKINSTSMRQSHAYCAKLLQAYYREGLKIFQLKLLKKN